jgi:hypothetical protein
MSDANAQRDIEFHRQGDGLTYRCRPCEPRSGLPTWKREDLDIWIMWLDAHGWIAVDAAGEILGIPWAVPLHAQGSAPPTGVWVSRKGGKAYVYDFVYV